MAGRAMVPKSCGVASRPSMTNITIWLSHVSPEWNRRRPGAPRSRTLPATSPVTYTARKPLPPSTLVPAKTNRAKVSVTTG